MSHVLTPTTLCGLTLKNRLVRSATWEGMAALDGSVTPRLLRYNQRVAAGGVGLVISSYIAVSKNGRQHPSQLAAHSDEHLPGLSRLAEAVHRGGRGAVPLFGQLVHTGGQSTRPAIFDQQPVAPSALDDPGYPERPRALNTGEVEGIVADFARAAGRLKAAGFDGVQLHAAHGYLIGQFLSPRRNLRSDRYGGSLQNRLRFALEVHAAVRAEVGPDFPLLVKLNGSDFLGGSASEAEATALARYLAEAGIGGIEVSGGTPASGPNHPVRTNILRPEQEAYHLPQAEAVRAAAPGVPLILVGGLRSLEKMEALLRTGAADLFALARPLIREPELPRRWGEGDLRRAACISCNGCFEPTHKGEGVRCVQEPLADGGQPLSARDLVLK